jgi:phosphatidylinositol alpha-1,6-mannosyltransferase
VRTIDKIVCLSRATAEKVKERGARAEQIEIIPGAVEKNPARYEKNDSLYNFVQNLLNLDLRTKKVLISVGRPVKRKGFDQFIKSVFLHLPDEFVYLIIGPKPSVPTWIKLLARISGQELAHNLLLASGGCTLHKDLVYLSQNHPRIFYINGASDIVRDKLLSVSDLFIMPNRTVEGDMEGFGLVALEASARGLPVLATGIEGITDAVIDGQNGYCFAEYDNKGMSAKILELCSSPQNLRQASEKAKEFTQEAFSHDKILSRYVRLFTSMLNSETPSSRR